MGAGGGSSRRASRRRAPGLLAAVALVVSGALGAAAATAPPAAAAGDPGLDALIVAPPSAGWRTAPASEVAAIVARITKLDDDGLSQPGSHVTVAAELWISPASDALVGVTLVQWPSAVDNLDRVVATGARQECVATTGNNPSTTGSLDTVSGSVTASCSGSGVSGMIVAAHRGSVSELVETYSLGPTGVPMPATQLDAMATTQFQRLPAVASSDAPVVATAVVVVAAASLLAVVVRRSRRRGRTVTAAPAGLGPGLWPAPSAYGMPPAATYPSPSAQQPVSQVPAGQTAPPGPALGEALAPLGGAPGWHPVGGDPLHLHYWDGTRWSSTVRWDGTEWREDGSAPPS